MMAADRPSPGGQRKQDLTHLRVPPKTTGDVPPIAYTRMRALPGLLERVPDEIAAPALDLGAGVIGDVERLLGEAQPHAALEMLDSAADALPAELVDDARSMRVRALLMDGRVDDARGVLGEVSKNSPGLALGSAALALAEGDHERAERELLMARERAPRSLGVSYLHALVRVARGDLQQALELLGDVARAAPWHAVARYQLGQLFLAQGDPARAGTLFEMSWAIAPTFVGPPLALAEMLVDARQHLEALSILQTACDAAPAALPPRMLQLRVLVEIGERDAALNLGRLLHEQIPDDVDIGLLYADALLEAGRGGDARSLLERALDRPGLDTTQGLRIRRLLARVALADRRVDDALELLKTAADIGGNTMGGEVWVEVVQIAAANDRAADVDMALVKLSQTQDISSLISGALLARQQRLFARARQLGERARDLVKDTPAEGQIEAFLTALPKG